MYLFSFLAAFFLLRRLRSSLRNTTSFARWDTLLKYAIWITIASFFIIASLLKHLAALGALCYLVGILLFVSKEPAFKHQRPFLLTYYPFLAITAVSVLIELLFPAFYEEWDSYFNMAVIGGFVWIFAKWANSRKQEEEIRMMTSQKDELEILVAERTAALTQQKEELQETLKELQATQAQLIQQEKLATLGELTAGIAHEIQNPLNFVNNFSEVSRELMDEIEVELNKGNKEEAAAIAGDVKQNLDKIYFHGKRADSIVKGMLQHSRSSTGKKEPTDINALADEYLRLSFHGLRAKDKSFNANFKTDFDESIGKIEVAPPEIGRVLLNIYNNAFYAVNEKKKRFTAATKEGKINPIVEYEPVITVSTKKISLPSGKAGVEIAIKDNGNGIPENIKDKIMQPFFTTKPPGQGTGLGLSISYDIVSKGHGGEIKIESKQGEGANFIIQLPL